MMQSLFTKTLYDKRWFMLGWSFVFAAMSFLVIIFYPSFSTSFQFDELTKNMPEALQGLVGNPDSFKTIAGYISDQLFNIRIPLMMLIMAIVLGLGLTISDEESGRMRTLLSAPISRSAVVISKLLAAYTIVGVVSLATIVALYLGILAVHESIPHMLIWQLFGLSWIFGMAAVSIVTCLGLAIGRRAPTTGISLLLTIGSFILTSFGVAVAWLKPYEKFSLLHYYDAAGLYTKTFSANDFLVLAGVSGVLLALALLRFRTRDIQ